MDTNEKSELLTKSDAMQFYSIADVMQITGLSRVSIHRRVKDKTLSAVKLGRRVLIPAEVIEKLKGLAFHSPNEVADE